MTTTHSLFTTPCDHDGERIEHDLRAAREGQRERSGRGGIRRGLFGRRRSLGLSSRRGWTSL